MKYFTFFKRFLFLFVATLFMSCLEAADLKTNSGKVYKNYQVMGVDGNEIMLMHSGGITLVNKNELPDSLRKRYFSKKNKVDPTAVEIRKRLQEVRKSRVYDASIYYLNQLLTRYPDHKDIWMVREMLEICQRRKLKKRVEIPNDYDFYLPLQTDWNRDRSLNSRIMKLLGQGRPRSGLVIAGVKCTFLPKRVRIYTKEAGGISLGNHSRTISIWCKNKRTKRNYWHAMMVYCGSESRYRRDIICMRDYGYYTCYTPGNVFRTNIQNDDKWHHFLLVYDAQARRVSFYIDGRRVAEGEERNSSWDLERGAIVLGGRYPQRGHYSDLYDDAYFAAFRIYNRALKYREIQMLAKEFQPKDR